MVAAGRVAAVAVAAGGQRTPAPDEGGVESAVVRIYRCSKVVKGGRTFSFGALVVAGDRKGNVGIGYGKANEVPPAVEKATKDARKQMVKVNLKGSTIPHTVKGTSGASSVVLVPARPGTGVTAGKSVRPCLELAGITDILTKAYGSTQPQEPGEGNPCRSASASGPRAGRANSAACIWLEKGAGVLSYGVGANLVFARRCDKRQRWAICMANLVFAPAQEGQGC